MSQLVALSLSIALLGGVATFLLRAIGLAVWRYRSQACFFHSGGDGRRSRQRSSATCSAAVLPMLACGLWSRLPLGGSEVGIAVIVAITAFVLSYWRLTSRRCPRFRRACTAMPRPSPPSCSRAQAKAIAMLTDIDYHTNPPLLIVLSMVAGALFGFASAKLPRALEKA